MKSLIIFLLLTIQISSNALFAQSTEAQQLLLNVEKLAQLKKILSNMKKGYEIVSTGYNTIKDISKGNFNLHDAFLNALLQVSPTVRKYKRVADIITCQAQIVKEYRSAFNRFKSTNLFNSSEITYMEDVYKNLFNKSLQNLNELSIVITAGKLRMSDDERIAAIDRIYKDISDKLVFLRGFNNEGSVLAVQRGRELVDTKLSEKLNGL
ncbi:TerB family tellurite resistance protein [Ferruginibacter paludis]|uniref:TerB family tellurite resistance protein n=1 Tax=Ferruginibacter paludis TaxID=1310417 RepID=UPI0025B43885|nr:TerB family tellurite resistance protein [Ferruginibacter paludis]MDN3654127.1 TerB family tellurite resistance protein [Ferruginibacter paludis]